MYMNRYSTLILLLFIMIGVSAQEDVSYRQPLSSVIHHPKDTIKLYLEDTSYYIKKDIQQLMYELNNGIGYFKYFTTTHGSEFEFKDKLSDGFYCLYNITRKQALKMKNYKKYFVASGEFKDGMKQGAFIFYVHQEYPTNKEPFNNNIEAFKRIYYKNDTVHGKVIEVIDGKINHFGEYNMGLKDGFFYDKGYKIILYENGLIIKETFFDL